MNNGRLQNKVAIITGAGTGIGEAVAHKFTAEGAKVLLCGLPDDPVDEVAQTLMRNGFEAVSFAHDIAEETHAAGAVDEAVKAFGRVDILVNNAGALPASAETDQFPVEAFDKMIRDNIRTAFLMTRYALPELHKTRGCIASAGSEAGQLGIANITPYGGTKGFMHAFMKGVAVEQAAHGVRANCVCPGPVDTAWTHKNMGPFDDEMEQTMVEATPLGRRGTPEEMANVYAFICSDEASYVTGATWFVDGGVTVSKGGVGQKVPDELRQAPRGKLDLAHQFEGRSY